MMLKCRIDNEYISDSISYYFVVEPVEQVLILLKPDAPVSCRFTAWHEIPFEKQIPALTLVLIGLLGMGIKITGKLR
jgi:hypothetical protein